jgi:hypothetical protein
MRTPWRTHPCKSIHGGRGWGGGYLCGEIGGLAAGLEEGRRHRRELDVNLEEPLLGSASTKLARVGNSRQLQVSHD